MMLSYAVNNALLTGGMLLSGEGVGTGGIDIGVKADVGQATTLMSGLMKPLGIILGILTWVLVVGIVIYTAVEVIYIVFPVVRGENPESTHNGMGKFVSADCKKAVQHAESNGTSPLLEYLKKRIFVYIVLGVLIALLLSGGAFKLINLGADVGKGFSDAVDGASNGIVSEYQTMPTE